MNTPRNTRGTPRRCLVPQLLFVASVLLAGCASSGSKASPAPPPGRETFATPEEALAVLVAAARADDETRLSALFGAENMELLSTEDKAAQELARQEFCAAADELTMLEPLDEDAVQVVLGEAAWPAPVPIVRAGGRWFFDAEAGIDEVLNRRVGRNELAAIELCRGYVDAQYLYRARDWNGDGVREYARKLESAPDLFDGLYWPHDEAGGMPRSPLDGLIEENEIYAKGRDRGAPWFGYYAKVLTRQGPDAPGGARDYIDGGHMTGGFALVAWPSEYPRSGVMSFLVSSQGTVYEQDLGADSAALCVALEVFDPGPGWTPVE